MRDKLKKLWQLISFRSLWDEDDEDDWEDFDTREDYISGADESGRLTGIKGAESRADTNAADAGSRKDSRKPLTREERTVLVWAIAAALAVAAILVYRISSRRHLYTSYRITSSYEGEDISGTSYAKLGNDFVKYGADGVTLVNASNETLWSHAYTMQASAFDQCGQSILIYEQQGSQVVVADRNGLTGQFETDLPILKGSVASNGVNALLLKNGEDSLIRLYSPDGTILAEVKPTLEQSGQPVALDLSSGATKLIVSMVKIGSGTVDSSIVFYDFSSAAESSEQHITGTVNYADEIFGEVFFASDSVPAAVGDSRFVVFSGTENPSERADVSVDGEITSVLHDEDFIGLVLFSDDAVNRYRLTVYNNRGKQTMDTLFNEGYEYAAFDSGEILLWSEGHMMAFTPRGVRRLDSDFEGRIELFVKIPGFRRYCVLSNSGITRIEAE